MGSMLSFPRVDLSNKVAVITGGNTGIGYETAKAIAVMGAHTIIACRSEERAHTAVEKMKEEVGREFPERSVIIEFMLLDLSSFRSTKDFTTAFRERNMPLHILINNAGIAWLPLTMTEDGYEAQFQVNHLSHMLLTLELLPILLDTCSEEAEGDCRIVFVSSRLHTSGEFVPGNMNAEQQYNRTKFYDNSKLYNIMTAYCLQRRLENVGVTVSTLHPGSVSEIPHVLKFYLLSLLRDAQKGATTTLNCAVNPKLNSQRCLYFVNCQPTLPSAIARNVIHQEQLWEISISIIKDWLSFSVLHKYGAPMGVEEIVPLPSVNLFSTSSRNNTEEETSAHQVLFQDTIQGTPLVTFNAAKYEDSNYSNSDEHTEDKPL